MGYDGFISYSHAADGRLAPALQAGLQRMAKPWNRRRALHIFRDESGLSTSPHLWSSIETALTDSDWFVLLASPEAAGSEWVNREIETWIATKPLDRLLPVVTAGTWEWDAERRELSGTAVPPALHGALADEPRHLDLRWAREAVQLDLRSSQFRGAVADLAAPMHGIPKDDLEGEDIRQHRRTRRLVRATFAGLSVLLVLAVVFGFYALTQRNRATDAARVADARRLAAQAIAAADTGPDLALLSALEARRLDDSVETRSALFKVLRQTDQLRHVVSGFSSSERVAGLSDDGRTMALSDLRGRVRLLDVATGRERASFLTNQNAPVDVTFAPGGTRLATLSAGGTVRIWNGSGHALTEPLTGHITQVISGAFSPDGRSLVTEGIDGVLLFWNAADGQQIATLPAALIAAGGVTFSADGRRLAIAAAPSFVVDMASRSTILQTTPRELFPDSAVAMSPDGRLLATASSHTRTVDLWDVDAQRMLPVSVAVPAGTNVSVLAFTGDGSTLVGGMADGSLARWRVDTGAVIGTPIVGHSDQVGAIRFRGSSAKITTASRSAVAVWDLARSGLSRSPSLGAVRLDDVAYSPDGRTLAVADRDGRVALLDARTLRTHGRPTVGSFDVYSKGDLSYTTDGKELIEAINGRLFDFDVKSRRRLPPPLYLPSSTESLALAPKHGLAAVLTRDGTAKLVNLKQWRAIWWVAREEERVLSIAFSPDARSLVYGTTAGRVLALDVRHPKRVTVWAIEPHAIRELAFTPDGDNLAVGLNDSTVQVLDASTHRPVGRPLATRTDVIGDLTVSPDGRLLVVNGRLVFDLETRQLVGDLASDLTLTRSVFSPDGRNLASLAEQEVRVWNLDPASWSRRACSIVGRNLTRAEWHDLLGSRAYHRTCTRLPAGR